MTVTPLRPRAVSHAADADPELTLHLHAGTTSTPAPERKDDTKAKNAQLYTDDAREDLLDQVRGGGVSGLIARQRLNNDSKRREAAEDAALRQVEFDVPTLARTRTGFAGRGGGRVTHVRRPNEFRGTTAQVPGFYPFPIGASAPLDGAPVGTHLVTGQPVGFDQLGWFEAGQITAPAAMVFGLNGFGKSSLNRRIVCHDLATGVRPLIMGDHRPDFVNMMRQMVLTDSAGRTVYDDDGKPITPQVTSVGFDSPMNPLAVGTFGSLISRLPRQARDLAEREMRARQVTAATGLLEICSGRQIAPHEETLLTTALRVLYEADNEFSLTHAPLPGDVLRLLREVPQTLVTATATASDHDPRLRRAQDLLDASGALGRRAHDEVAIDRYLLLTENLRQSLDQLVSGQFGEIFNAPTREPINIDALGVCVDMSRLPANARKLRAAVLLACWSDGFSAVEASHLLSDHGLQSPGNYDLVCDEFSLVLGVGNGIVWRVDEVTRVQREQGTGTLFTTHTVKDLKAFDSMEDRQRAMGFLDRARVKVCFPLPEDEAALMEGKVNLNDQEAATLAEWATTPRGVDDPVVDEISEADWENGVRATTRKIHTIPPGMGKFLIKEGEQPGIPVQMHLTATERSTEIHNTNKRFARGRATKGTGA